MGHRTEVSGLREKRSGSCKSPAWSGSGDLAGLRGTAGEQWRNTVSHGQETGAQHVFLSPFS